MNWFYIIIVLLGCSSCASKKRRAVCSEGCSGDSLQSGQIAGFDVYGKNKSCEPKSDLMCSMNWQYPEDALPAACEAQQGKTVQCGCHDFICTKKILLPSKRSIVDPDKVYKGYDAFGRKKECKEAVGLTCAEEWRYPEDALPEVCRNKGALLIQCGCHDFICSSRIELEAPQDREESSSGGIIQGFDVYGNLKTCQPLPRGSSCTEIFEYPEDAHPEVCEKFGGIVTQCKCHEYICSQKVHYPLNQGGIDGDQVTGFDVNGDRKTCSFSLGSDCNEAWKAPNDELPGKCFLKGGVISSCGCHDFLCSVRVK